MAKKIQESQAKGLDLALETIKKKFGTGSIVRLNNESLPNIDFIPFQHTRLNKAVGGGIARGHITEIFGPESVGKTSLCTDIIIQAQRMGLTCAFIDAENVYDLAYANKLGVDTEKLLFSQPNCGEESLSIMEYLVRSGEIGLVIVDSIAHLVPAAEIAGEIGDAHMGLMARLMGQAMRKTVAIIGKTNTAVVFTNQTRASLAMYTSPITTPGGQAVKFAASQRIQLRRKEILDKDGEIGIRVLAKVIKNKVGIPYQECELNIISGIGIDWADDLLSLAIDLRIAEQSGAWYTIEGERVQGTSAARSLIRCDKEISKKLLHKVSEAQKL